MTDVLRLSPSGRLVLINTDEVANESSAPGATVTEALDSLNEAVEGLTVESLYDEFIGGRSSDVTATDTNAGIGELGWNYVLASGTGSVVRAVTQQDCAGSYEIIGDASSGLGALYLLNATASSVAIPFGVVNFAEWTVILDPGSNVDGTCYVGLGNTTSSAQLGNGSLLFEAGPALSSGLIRCVSRPASTPFTIASSVAATTRSRLRLDRVGSRSWTWSVNDTVVMARSGVDVPSDTALWVPILMVQPSAANAQRAIIDTFRLKITLDAP